MTSFYVTSFICSSVRATLTIFSMTSALVQKLALTSVLVTVKIVKVQICLSIYGSTKKTCQSNLSTCMQLVSNLLL